MTTPQITARRPGDLFAGALERIRGKVAAIHGTEAVKTGGRRLLTFYLEVIMKPKFKSEPSQPTMRELTTLASALDAILVAEPARAGDILIGRFKALEAAHRDGAWTIAREYEVVPPDEEGLVSHEERCRATFIQLRIQRLQQFMNTVHAPPGRQSRG